MSKHRVLSLKPQLRLEWRGQDGQNETEQPDHSASLGDSITSATRIRFSVHTGPSLGRKRPMRAAIASGGGGGTPLPHVPSKMIAISGSIERRETSGIQRGRGTDTKVYGPRADRTEDTKGMAGVRPQRLRRTARDASRRRGSQGACSPQETRGYTGDHSGNPAFRSPSIISFAFVCPPRAIHSDIVKTGSSPSRCAAASRASASRPRWAKADARQR